MAIDHPKPHIADLHVHTVLSPCATVEMIPPLIVQQALEKGIQLIAITDHNAIANTNAVQNAARGTSLKVIPGMEIQTQEEVHLLCLFETVEQLRKWYRIVEPLLPDIMNTVDFFGEQFVVDRAGRFLRREDRLLATSAQISFDRAVKSVHEYGGLAIPAHIDRPAFSLSANLGFLPTGVPVDALEISKHVTPEKAQKKFPWISKIPLIQGGDAHYLDEMSTTTVFSIVEPTLAEIRLALNSHCGRSVSIQFQTA